MYRMYAAGRFRDDIQTIRAFGAITIVVYHIWLHKVSGGVDVFFVISGYLMTGILLRAYARTARIDFLGFWGRIAMRVSPSAYLILLCTLIASYFLLPPTLWRETINEMIYSAIHLENLKLIAVGADYLQREHPPSPFQQFWALSIQIQFLAILPFVMLLGFRVADRFRSVRGLAYTFGMVWVASFLFSIVYTNLNPSAAYFNTGARFWEFLTGALVAILAPFLSLSARVLRIVAFISLGVILTTGLVIDRSMHFPGYVALFPVLAAALLILADGAADQSRLLQRLLGSPALIKLGSVSFTIYLWHWPLLIFFQHHYATTTLSLLQGLVVIVLSVGLAFATTTLIERPISLRRSMSVWRPWVVAVTFALPVLISGLLAHRYVYDLFDNGTPVAQVARTPGIERGPLVIEQDASGIEIRQVVNVGSDITEAVTKTCDLFLSSSEVVTCEFGNLDVKKSVVLVGGSHASHWATVFSILGNTHGFKLISITKSGCSLGYNKDNEPTCDVWMHNVVDKIRAISPDLVITNSTRLARGGEHPAKEFVPDGYAQKWQELTDAGIPVLGIRDTPWFQRSPSACAWVNRSNVARCARSRDSLFMVENPADHFEQLVPAFHSVDFTDLFCGENVCPVYASGILMYRDTHHLTRSYMQYVAAATFRLLEEQKPGLLPVTHGPLSLPIQD